MSFIWQQLHITLHNLVIKQPVPILELGILKLALNDMISYILLWITFFPVKLIDSTVPRG